MNSVAILLKSAIDAKCWHLVQEAIENNLRLNIFVSLDTQWTPHPRRIIEEHMEET